MPSAPSDRASVLKTLKEEINKLSDEQLSALKSATYVGMTPVQAQECEQRRKKITELMNQFFDLQNI